MAFTYEIMDHDVGGKVFSSDNFTFEELVKTVNRDIASADFADEAEYFEDDDAKEDLKKWNVSQIMSSLKAFDFANGFCSWHLMLPGKHREIIVTSSVS